MSTPRTRTGRYLALPGLTAQGYTPHPMHAEPSVWTEKNCYIDVWIELLHALKLEPAALMSFTLAVDFEGDHWTFFKPPHPELQRLYGLDVQELNVWRPLLDHAAEHLPAGKLISTEADAYWLPDTAGTDYRRHHVKTTIVINEVDVDRQRMGYFHSAGYYALEGEDFRRLFQLDGPPSPEAMPLYAELVRTDRLQRRPADALARLSLESLREQYALRPATNPVTRFAARFAADLPLLHEQGMEHYHAWAFTTIRQLGAAFELAAHQMRWLAPLAQPQLLGAAERFELISHEMKALILKGARVVNGRKAYDAEAALAPVAQAWDDGMAVVGRALAGA